MDLKERLVRVPRTGDFGWLRDFVRESRVLANESSCAITVIRSPVL